MDYGRTNPPTDTPDFFTSGAGTNDENVNNFEANNNLDLTNPESTWDQPMTPERDERAIGNKTKISSELPMPTAEMPAAPRYGEIIDLEPAPVPKPFPDQPDQPDQNTPEQIGGIEEMHQPLTPENDLEQDPDRISDAEMKEVEKNYQKLSQDGNTEQYYAATRALTVGHIKKFKNPYWGKEEAA